MALKFLSSQKTHSRPMKIIMRCDSHDKTQLSGLKLQATQLNVVMRQSS